MPRRGFALVALIAPRSWAAPAQRPTVVGGERPAADAVQFSGGDGFKRRGWLDAAHLDVEAEPVGQPGRMVEALWLAQLLQLAWRLCRPALFAWPTRAFRFAVASYSKVVGSTSLRRYAAPQPGHTQPPAGRRAGPAVGQFRSRRSRRPSSGKGVTSETKEGLMTAASEALEPGIPADVRRMLDLDGPTPASPTRCAPTGSCC
jgi:hypothetical protein